MGLAFNLPPSVDNLVKAGLGGMAQVLEMD